MSHVWTGYLSDLNRLLLFLPSPLHSFSLSCPYVCPFLVEEKKKLKLLF